jgi:hypothetical protein
MSLMRVAQWGSLMCSHRHLRWKIVSCDISSMSNSLRAVHSLRMFVVTMHLIGDNDLSEHMNSSASLSILFRLS